MDSFWIYKIQYHDSFTRAPAEAWLFFQNLADIRSEQGWQFSLHLHLGDKWALVILSDSKNAANVKTFLLAY